MGCCIWHFVCKKRALIKFVFNCNYSRKDIVALSLNAAFAKADNYISKKEFAAAEKVLKNILSAHPTNKKAKRDIKKIQMSLSNSQPVVLEPNPNIRKSILFLYNNGQTEEVLEKIEGLLLHFPESTFLWNVRGASYRQIGNLDKAEDAYRKAIKSNPNFIDALNNLGAVLKEKGDLLGAKEVLNRAIGKDPKFPEALNNLGNVLSDLGDYKAAETAYEKALGLKPDYPEAQNNLGVALKNSGLLKKAQTCFEEALKLWPNYVEACNNLGTTFFELGQYEKAKCFFDKSVKLRPKCAKSHNNLGLLYRELGRLEDAIRSCRFAIRLQNNYPSAHNNLGMVLQDLGKLDEAEASFRLAISLKGDFAEAHNNLGLLLQDRGKLEAAKSSFKFALKLKPNFPEAHRHLSLVKKFVTKDEQFMQMCDLYTDQNLASNKRCHICFSLAKAHEDLKEFEQAFKFYKEGNELGKILSGYDIQSDIEQFKELRIAYEAIRENALKIDDFCVATSPIFIIGMPRSGTTLIEQILSCHSEVFGAGELPFASQFGDKLARGLSEMNKDSIISFREKYLDSTKRISGQSTRVIDKMPQNFRYIGLLSAAFPEAKILHIKRNPSAVCWGNYKQYFVSKHLGYSWDLNDIKIYYDLYYSLMEFWEQKLEDRIYSVQYESITSSQEVETRYLLEHLGLKWEDRCMAPQDNERLVNTASSAQVRQKIYQGSSKQWTNYKPFLNGKIDFERKLYPKIT